MRKGDFVGVGIKGEVKGVNLYYVCKDKFIYRGKPTHIVATDIENKNTYRRYSEDYIKEIQK